MKRILTLSLLLFSLFIQAQNGSIQGLVLDENSFPVPGALIQVDELEAQAISSDLGEFTLLSIPAGKYELQISSLGYTQKSATVIVADGQVSNVKITLSPKTNELGEVIVTGYYLQNQAKALNQQKENIGVSNVVSADQTGRFPDANIGDAIKRIPGITMQNDQGEARDIIIRGLAPQLNSVMINGERMPSAEGDNRRIQMDLIPTDMIQTIEVSKAVTPDMDADAIGGAVNLVTRQAPNRLRISATGATGYNFLSQKPIWTGALIFANRFAKNKLGVVLSASVFDHDFGSDNTEFEWSIDENGGSLTDYQVRTYDVRRLRQSYSLALDYRLGKGHTLFFNGIYNNRKDWENRYRLRFNDIEEDDNGNLISNVERETKGGTPDIDNRRLENQTTYNFALGGEHLFGRLKVNWNVNTARAEELRPNERYSTYVEEGVMIEQINPGNTREPLMRPTSEVILNNYELDEMTEENQNTYDQDLNARLDLELPILTGRNQSSLKFGGRLRTKEKVRDNDFFEYEFVGNTPTMGDLDAGGNVYRIDRADRFLAGDYFNFTNAEAFVSSEYLGSLDLNNASQFDKKPIAEEFAPTNYRANEEIYGGYVMYTQNIGRKHQIIGGVRLENTVISYEGNEFDLDTEEITPTGLQENSYLNVLPAILYRLNLTENAVIRASWTNTLARPNYYDLVPYVALSTEDQEIEQGNPDLEAATAINFDLGAEYYFKSLGVVGVAGFYKSIDNFIFTNVFKQDFQGEEYEFRRPENGATATVYGVEISFQRQLDFLPSFLRNLNFFGNYTYTYSEAEGIIGREGETVRFAGAAPNMLNLSLAYEDARTMIRLSYNYAGGYIDEYGDDKFEDRFYDGQQFLDFNFTFKFAERWRVFLEVNNLLNTPLRYYQYQEQYTMQVEYYNVRANLGVKFDL
jgi:TonB-dependent receptor